MIKKLEEEHKNLPDKNAFGISNETDKEELLAWIKNLNSVLELCIEEELELDVALWLNKSSHSALNDYQSSPQDPFLQGGCKARFLVWCFLFFNILRNNGQGCASARGCKIAWRPQYPLPISFFKFRELFLQ